MKSVKIFDMMDLARRARNLNLVFNPLFVGPPGVGKSQIVQQWCEKNNLPFIDLRSAYLEPPDVIGFPSIENVSGRQSTVHNIPEFWPHGDDWEGVVLLEEPNRGTSSILNCWMQLLTDRKIHKYVLPKGALIVGCINPESELYDVNSMDSALKDRFEFFNIEYDKETFVEYIKSVGWHKDLILFIESGSWTYSLPEDIKNVPGSKYISPRTLSKLNTVLQAGFKDEDELLLYNVILGANVGRDFYNFRHNESPVFFYDLVKSLPEALEKLSRFSNPSSYKNGLIAITVKDIIDNGTIKDDLLAEVVTHIPVDQARYLISELEFKRHDRTILTRLCQNYKHVKDVFKEKLNYGK